MLKNKNYKYISFKGLGYACRLCLILVFCVAAGVSALPATYASAAGQGEESLKANSKKLLDDARAAMAAGKEKNALASYLAFLEAHPDNQEALQAAGEILLRQENYEEASNIYLRLLRLKPDDGKNLLSMGLIRQRLGQGYEAQATLQRALDGKSLSVEEAGRARDALALLYDNWDVLTAMQQHDDNAAQERFHTYQINKAPESAVVSYALRGFVRHSLHRPEEALSDFDTALSMGGMAEDLRSAVLRSKEDIIKAREIENFWAEIHRTVKDLEAQNDQQKLEEYYTGLLENESSRVFAAVRRAFVKASRSDYDGAESDLRYALSSNPDERAKADIEKGLREISELWIESDKNAARRKAEALKAHTGSPGTTPPAGITAGKSAGKSPSGTQHATGSYLNPYPYFDEADKYIQQRNYGMAETVLSRLRRASLNKEEKGIYLFFRAELDWHQGKKDQAYKGYRQASRMVKEKYRRSAIYTRLAEYYALQGDEQQAAANARRSADILPHEPWKLVQVAGIYSNIGMIDKAIAGYKAALALRPEPRTAANALSGITEAYKTQNDKQNYLRYAREYVDTVRASEPMFSTNEKGLAAFYQAELYEAGSDPAKAFGSLKSASGLLTEKYRLSDTYVRMARYQARHGDPQLAGSYAESAAALLPDQIWRLQEAIGIFQETGNVEKAEIYTRQAISLDPAENGSLYQDLAGLHLRMGDRENFLSNNIMYIDYLLARIEKSGRKASREDMQKLYDARKRQKEVSRTWGFASYHYYSRTNDGDYFYGMTNELYREFRLPNGRYGKFYGQYVGTLTSFFSGDYFERTTMQRKSWVSRQHLKDSAHGILGVQIHPFTSLYDLSFDAEYVFPLHDGNDKDDDLRFRITYGWTKGDEPMPFGNVWDYIKVHASATYSVRDGDVSSSYDFNGGDVTAGSEFRYGKTLVTDLDRNLLIIPFVQARATYWGRKREPGERWQLEAGPSILIKKWFNEDKYHTPKSSLELQFYYNWGLNGRHDNTFGINAAISF